MTESQSQKEQSQSTRAQATFDHVSRLTEESLPPYSTQPTSTSSINDGAAATTQAPLRLAIVGGGMGGLALMLGLLKQSHLDVHIYEAAAQFGEIGAGISVGPNAQRALAMLGPEVEQAYLSQATHNLWDSHRKEWFEYRVGKGPDKGKFIAALENDYGQSTVHRARFVERFAALVPPERAHFGKKLVRIDDRSKEGGSITLYFKDGTTAAVDALIGADGVHSVVRKHLLGEDHPAQLPQYTGTVAYRGLLPMEKAIQAVGDEVAQNAHVMCGHGGHVIMYPVDSGKTVSLVAATYSRKTWDHDQWVVPVKSSEVLDSFNGWDSRVTNLLGMLDRPAAWSVWDHPRAPFYNSGRVCMTGDAAHASTPYQGQGAAQAIEDALVLTTLLGRIEHVDEIEHAFVAYDVVRRPRSQKNVKTSREAGIALSFQDQEIGEDYGKLAANLLKRMDWIWDKNLVEQNDEAIAYMESLHSKPSWTSPILNVDVVC